jgi:hypothetical protein
MYDRESTGTHRCPACQAVVDARRASQRNTRPRAKTTARGLGHAHRKRVETELAGITHCQCTGCPWCGDGCGRAFTKANPKTGGHTTPRSKGGAASPLRAECLRCNSAKGDR